MPRSYAKKTSPTWSGMCLEDDQTLLRHLSKVVRNLNKGAQIWEGKCLENVKNMFKNNPTMVRNGSEDWSQNDCEMSENGQGSVLRPIRKC